MYKLYHKCKRNIHFFEIQYTIFLLVGDVLSKIDNLHNQKCNTIFQTVKSVFVGNTLMNSSTTLIFK